MTGKPKKEAETTQEVDKTVEETIKEELKDIKLKTKIVWQRKKLLVSLQLLN